MLIIGQSNLILFSKLCFRQYKTVLYIQIFCNNLVNSPKIYCYSWVYQFFCASSFQSPRCRLVLLLSLLPSPTCLSYNITSPQFRSSYLSVSTHFHVLTTISYSAFLSIWPNHLSMASLIFSLATPALALIFPFLTF